MMSDLRIVIFIWLIIFTQPVSGQLKQLEVFPVFFIPKGEEVSQQALQKSAKLVQEHLLVVQNQYRSILALDRSFLIAEATNNFYKAQESYEYYQQSTELDVAHRIVNEFFSWNKDDRIKSNKVYLVIVLNNSSLGFPKVGGGRTFNGQPGSGGGVILMEWSSLQNDQPYPFLSTLIHELGHAFGLTHVDCFGYDMSKNTSIMSYNLEHHTSGLKLPKAEWGLNPEEFFILSQNQLAFPDFQFEPNIHNPEGIDVANVERCYLGRMTDYIGEVKQQEGQGYELFYNDQKVNGPDAAFYTLIQAEKNCQWNVENKPGIKIKCSYNGAVIFPTKE